MTVDQLTEIFKALLTPVIALIGTYIAWQQWKANRLKLALDRYDRRLRTYQEVIRILSIIIRDAKASDDDLLRFRTAVSDADFLFGPEISAYIDQIYKRGIDLWNWTRQYRDYTQEKPEGYDHGKIVEGMHLELTWFGKQHEAAKLMFKPYLNISA